MAEMFYGPWRVTAAYVDTHYSEQFVISGSDNADGEYVPWYPDGKVLEVTGERWSIDLQLMSFDPPATWVSKPAARHTAFVPPLGLIVTVERMDFPRVRVICTSRDPTINPNLTANPYDFTLPERGWVPPCSGGTKTRA